MPLTMTTPFADPDLNAAIRRFVTRNRFLDHRLRFTVNRDGIVRTAVHAAVSLTGDFPGVAPFAFPNHPVVHISLTDAHGDRFPLPHCVRVSEAVPVFGLLYRDGAWDETWLLRSRTDRADLATADAVRDYEVIRISGVSETGAEDITLRDGVIYEGEFFCSEGPDPVLVSCAWHAALGEFAPGFGTPEKAERDRRTREAALARVAAFRPARRLHA